MTYPFPGPDPEFIVAKNKNAAGVPCYQKAITVIFMLVILMSIRWVSEVFGR